MKSVMDETSQSILFTKISRICALVNSSFNTKELLESSLKLTLELFNASRGSIFILKNNNKELVLEASKGMKRKEADDLVKRMGEGIVGKIAELKQPIFVEDISTDKRFQHFNSSSEYQTSSFICAPLMLKDSLIGVINITDKVSGKQFEKNDMQLLDFLASQIALNYRRIQLYKKFKLVVKEKVSLENKLGETALEKNNLKKQIVIQEKLATIGKLAGGIAHEFNNPLDGVMRYTNLSLEQIHEDEEVVRGYLLEIKHGLKRMANIVKNLLACSRNEKPINDTVDFRLALENSLVAKEAGILHKNIRIIKNIESGIPMLKDFGIERILINLISNAVDAVNQNGTITISAWISDYDFLFSIADDGVGIESQNIEKMFEPFYTTKDMDKGCGLGLTIVGEVVKTYRGDIDVESEVNKGTVFNIKLPLKDGT